MTTAAWDSETAVDTAQAQVTTLAKIEGAAGRVAVAARRRPDPRPRHGRVEGKVAKTPRSAILAMLDTFGEPGVNSESG